VKQRGNISVSGYTLSCCRRRWRNIIRDTISSSMRRVWHFKRVGRERERERDRERERRQDEKRSRGATSVGYTLSICR
jgi:hypothetical protein